MPVGRPGHMVLGKEQQHACIRDDGGPAFMTQQHSENDSGMNSSYVICIVSLKTVSCRLCLITLFFLRPLCNSSSLLTHQNSPLLSRSISDLGDPTGPMVNSSFPAPECTDVCNMLKQHASHQNAKWRCTFTDNASTVF